MEKTPRSFIREILKTTEKPEVISFAGGLPSPSLFAVEELAAAARDVMADSGRAALQYSTTEGYLRCGSSSPIATGGASASPSTRTRS
jgi:2-aminoadipate transaminase